MRPMGVVIGVICAAGALSAVVWFHQYSPWGDPPPPPPKQRYELGTAENTKPLVEKKLAEDKVKAEAAKKEAEADSEPAPPIADKPPYPKAVTGERVHEFGSMGVNEEKKFKFRIENKGEAPLKLAKGRTTCKCTISNLAKREIPPGGFAEVELAWTPKKPESPFTQTAIIRTNDPEQSEISFKVYGKVAEKFMLIPELGWNAGYVSDVQDGKVVGRVESEIDPKFKITSIDSDSTHVKTKWDALSKRELERDSARGGYRVTVDVDNGIPAGRFRSQLKIHTTLEGNKTITVDVLATRSGPILFLPPVPIVGRGATWNVEKSILSLGRFDHEQGVKTALSALIYGMKDKFKILDVNTGTDFMKVSVEPNLEISQGEQQGVRFIFEIPPNSPAVTRVSPNAVHVALTTNHPKLKVLSFDVEFISQ